MPNLPKPYWTDGERTIYCGDARELVPLLADRSVDFIFTDPPYGHNNNNGDLIAHWEAALGRGPSGEARPIAGDGPEANEMVRWFFAEASRLLVPGGCCCCCCCGGGGPDPQFARWSLWLDEALGFKHAVVWDKGGLGMGWHYRRNYEFVLIGQKRGARCKWFGDNRQANLVRIKKIIPRANDHPTPKPPALAAHFIALHSQRGELILDPFLGGGSTLLAAAELDRRAIGIELEERWCELAVSRLEALKEGRAA